MQTVGYVIRRLVDWFVRPRSTGIRLINAGFGLIAAFLGGGWFAGLNLAWPEFSLGVSVQAPGGAPALLVYAACTVALVLIVAGLVMEAARYVNELRAEARRKTIVIEARGLRDFAGSPLIRALSATYPRNRDEIVLDLRQRVTDGDISDPAPLLATIEQLPTSLHQRETGRDRADIIRVYGGLAPVPLTFLTGTVLDDEMDIDIYDWDRHDSRWRPLDADDDGDRLTTHGLDGVPANTSAIVLAVSVSYKADFAAIESTFPECPVVHAALRTLSSDAHWSEHKQAALGRQFLNIAKKLAESETKRIHLVLAAPNSVVFRFGRLYDRRNLPALSVYQYDRSPYPNYPWGVAMPVSGNRGSHIERPRRTERD